MSHSITWFEIPTADLSRAQKFYEAMLGVTLKTEEFFGTPMAMFVAGQDEVTGALVKMKGREPGPSGTVVYLDVDGRLDACLGRVSAAGGAIVQPRTAIGPQGFMAVVRDTEGNHVALHSQKP